jgi:hypothetical protein
MCNKYFIIPMLIILFIIVNYNFKDHFQTNKCNGMRNGTSGCYDCCNELYTSRNNISECLSNCMES